MPQEESVAKLPKRRILVQIDSLNAPDGTPAWFEAFTTGARWNGFATPWFDAEMAHRLVRAFNARWRTRNGHGPKAWFEAQKDAYVFVDDDLEGGEEAFMGQTVDGQVLYPIGAWSWSWSAAGDFDP